MEFLTVIQQYFADGFIYKETPWFICQLIFDNTQEIP
jgi:hypothetical protein